MQINLSHKILHFKKLAKTSRGAYSEHSMIIVSMLSDDGKRIGLGECAPLPDLSADRDAYTTLSAVSELIKKALSSENYAEVLRPYPALLFALESAMYDYQQNPILYDTPFAKGCVGIPTNGLVWMASYDEMLKQVKEKLLAGFKCIKLKIGAIDWEEEMRLISTVRSRFSPDTLQLRVDANGAFTPDEAMEKLKELSRYSIHSIEQPIKQYQWHDMERLCRESPVPIALDEELIGVNTLEEKRVLLDTIRPQFIVVKPTMHGGITGTMEWVSEASKRGIGSWLTSALESNIGLRNVALLAARIYNITPENSHTVMPQGLGTGLLYKDNIEMDIELRGNKLWRWETVEAC